MQEEPGNEATKWVDSEHFVYIPNAYTVSQGFEIHASRKQMPSACQICTPITTLLVVTSLMPSLHMPPCERMASGDETKH